MNSPSRDPQTANPRAEKHNNEQAFQQTRSDFTVAVYQLTACRPVPGTGGQELSLVQQVQSDLFQTRTGSQPSTAFKSQPPIWLEGGQWIANVENTLTALAEATGNSNAAKTLTERLGRADGHAYAPADTNALDAAVHGLQAAIQAAGALLTPPQFTIAAVCPACDARYFTRDDIRVDTLQARDNAITCHSCHTTWAGPDLWTLLDRINAANEEAEEDAGGAAAG